MAIKQKNTKLDNAIVVLDERISATFYKVILVNGMLLALLGLALTEPVPIYFGFGFLVLGLFTIVMCMVKINKNTAVIKALTFQPKQ